MVVSLQNGFNELMIAEVVSRERTMGAFINSGADVLEPGVVHFGGRGAVVLGELDGRQSGRLARVHKDLLNFEPNAITTNNIWGKMGYGALLFASALTPASIVDVLDSRNARPVLTDLAREVIAVAAAEGVTPMGFNGYNPRLLGCKEPARPLTHLSTLWWPSTAARPKRIAASGATSPCTTAKPRPTPSWRPS